MSISSKYSVTLYFLPLYIILCLKWLYFTKVLPNILKFLPSVRIFGGTKDPLRDDGILFYEKLVKLGKDVKYTEFKYFPHGYLNYDFPIMMQEVSKANDMIIQEMEKFISFHKEQ